MWTKIDRKSVLENQLIENLCLKNQGIEVQRDFFECVDDGHIFKEGVLGKGRREQIGGRMMNVTGFRSWRLSCFLVVWLWTSHLMSLIFSFFCSFEILVPVAWWLIYNNQISWSEYAVNLVEYWSKCFCWWQFIFPFSASCHCSELEIWIISISSVFVFCVVLPAPRWMKVWEKKQNYEFTLQLI